LTTYLQNFSFGAVATDTANMFDSIESDMPNNIMSSFVISVFVVKIYGNFL